jgi:hypothetical protein
MITYRFKGIDIDIITMENYVEILPASVTKQLQMFMPPEGSFDEGCLKRYLENLKQYEEEDPNFGLTLANRLRLAFSDMIPDTICSKFPLADLPLKRRLRCVAEYLIRSGEFEKLKDENGKLVKKRGMLGKMVVLYKPTAKLQETMHKLGLKQYEQA